MAINKIDHANSELEINKLDELSKVKETLSNTKSKEEFAKLIETILRDKKVITGGELPKEEPKKPVEAPKESKDDLNSDNIDKSKTPITPKSPKEEVVVKKEEILPKNEVENIEKSQPEVVDNNISNEAVQESKEPVQNSKDAINRVSTQVDTKNVVVSNSTNAVKSDAERTVIKNEFSAKLPELLAKLSGSKENINVKQFSDLLRKKMGSGPVTNSDVIVDRDGQSYVRFDIYDNDMTKTNEMFIYGDGKYMINKVEA